MTFEAIMDFHTYSRMRDWNRRIEPEDRPAQAIDQFYNRAIADAQRMRSGQFFGRMLNERDWEKARRPYYNVWPSVIPMLNRRKRCRVGLKTKKACVLSCWNVVYDHANCGWKVILLWGD